MKRLLMIALMGGLLGGCADFLQPSKPVHQVTAADIAKYSDNELLTCINGFGSGYIINLCGNEIDNRKAAAKEKAAKEWKEHQQYVSIHRKEIDAADKKSASACRSVAGDLAAKYNVGRISYVQGAMIKKGVYSCVIQYRQDNVMGGSQVNQMHFIYNTANGQYEVQSF